MLRYILWRLAESIPLLVGITLVCFIAIHLAPGDPTLLMGDFDPRAHANAAMKDAYGLNQPIWQQYLHWLNNLLHLNWGVSLAPGNMPVINKISAALPITLGLNIAGLFLTLLVSIPLGMWVATRPRTAADTTLTALMFIGLAAPSFWLALMGMNFFGLTLGWLPLSGVSSYGTESLPWLQRWLDVAWHLTLPIGVGLIGSVAGITRFVRGNMMSVLASDYILTSRAKGASAGRTLTRHALRNALLPVITILGLSLPGLLGGSVILESIFALPGLGQLFYTAVMMRDYPVIMALLTLGAALTLLGNMLADIAYAWADPRTRD